MKLFRIYVFTLLLISIVTTQTSAYTDSSGIETGDLVNLDYVLSYDDAVQQNGPGFETYVSPDGLIQGFYEGLLGMKIGEQKNIVVPIGKGYPPSHELGDKILYFDVTINTIIQNVRDDNYAETPTDPTVTNRTIETISNSSDSDGVQLSHNPFVIFLGISTLALFKKRN